MNRFENFLEIEFYDVCGINPKYVWIKNFFGDVFMWFEKVVGPSKICLGRKFL